MFLRVKNKINADIESLKDTMFLTAVENIIKRLDILQVIQLMSSRGRD